MRAWILKTEPSECSLDDVLRRGAAGMRWDGIRNFQARNHLREMLGGDRCIVCHSGVRVPALVGSAEVLAEAYPDPAQFDPGSPYHDPRATPSAPRWLAIDIRFRARFDPPVAVAALREVPELRGLALLRQGRLSVAPVTGAEWLALRPLLHEVPA